MKSPTAPSGFTLLEMLVVMVMVTLISTLLIEAMGYVLNIQRRSAQQTYQLEDKAMLEDWLRQLLQGLQPDLAGGTDVFSADREGMKGLSTHPLSTLHGELTEFTLSLQRDDALTTTDIIYRSGDQEMKLMHVKDGSLHWIYGDDQGVFHDRWPPDDKSWPQIPALIRLQGQDMDFLAAPQGPRNSPPVSASYSTFMP
ncbi:MAG: type II secretion system protein [Pseudomonadales bacterium]|nr:type II secretion system protein [Pseudomonadales bacterium]